MSQWTNDPEADAENYFHRQENTCECGTYARKGLVECNDCDNRMCWECGTRNAAKADVSKPLCSDCREVYLEAKEARLQLLSVQRKLFPRVSRL